ncbi:MULTISPECIES: prolipoprotein diacylglyceryl transferase [Carnobacterium]|uniref:Phosphatidylglycerol--prolipoprotein diacylglyceryl transferase n=2 Tax=Carnobacterium inhibens TaxID=147709 RepID=U5SB16_9LACT|nr:prolipoprotein diacylglyceryl transferase [Carnobacterium inhibens]AGY81027.1 prolipoprotein diacylglyceryl transferase [Carnobacterium inhibens subsp. gilichinskyi]MBC9825742.1 prolipoprotein diacylglyceryl transferase [Carnobacterium inhibens]MCM3513394.1 prolipoprotein diacylglyceryl transferase [Carnobacterium inhibens]
MNNILGAIDPIAFSFGSLDVYWYGIIIATGIFAAIFLSTREAEKRGIEGDHIVDMALWAIPLAFIGARLYYVLFELGYYLEHPSQIIAIWNGGIAIYGGLIAGGLTVYWYTKKKGIPIWLMLDILAPNVLLAQAMGRWGNFMNQEAHGGEVTRTFLENLFLPDFIINQMEINGVYYHPTFLYESLWSLLGFILIVVLRNKKHLLRQGEVALSYVLWYSFGRFFIEGLRTDSLWLFDFIRISQALSLLLFVAALSVWIYRRRDYPPVPYYLDGMNQQKKNVKTKKK